MRGAGEKEEKREKRKVEERMGEREGGRSR